MRVVPDGVVALTAVERPAFPQVAVGQQNRCGGRIGVDAHRIGGEHVRAIEKICDAAEALGLALAAVDVAGAIDALQRLVRLGIDEGRDLERERGRRRLGQRERAVGELVVLLAERAAVDRNRGELQVLAIKA